MTGKSFKPTGNHFKLLRDLDEFILGEDGVQPLAKAGDVGELVFDTKVPTGFVPLRFGNHVVQLPWDQVKRLSHLEELALASEEKDEWWSVSKDGGLTLEED
jgi:hypothetical protein